MKLRDRIDTFIHFKTYKLNSFTMGVKCQSKHTVNTVNLFQNVNFNIKNSQICYIFICSFIVIDLQVKWSYGLCDIVIITHGYNSRSIYRLKSRKQSCNCSDKTKIAESKI